MRTAIIWGLGHFSNEWLSLFQTVWQYYSSNFYPSSFLASNLFNRAIYLRHRTCELCTKVYFNFVIESTELTVKERKLKNIACSMYVCTKVKMFATKLLTPYLGKIVPMLPVSHPHFSNYQSFYKARIIVFQNNSLLCSLFKKCWFCMAPNCNYVQILKNLWDYKTFS